MQGDSSGIITRKLLLHIFITETVTKAGVFAAGNSKEGMNP